MGRILEDLLPDHREMIVEIIGAGNPELLAKLQCGQVLTRDQQDHAADLLYNEFAKNFRPGHEPNERGALISSTVTAFANWFIDYGDDGRNH